MPVSRLAERHALPPGLLDITPEELHTVVPEPTLIHLPGRLERPLFVSIMLHGNEPVGLYAIQRLLKKYAGRPLPRALSLFVGNVVAAREGLRRLDSQPDFNRVWPGTPHDPCPETAVMAAITETMAQRRVFASIDVHNNTGTNPHYACINRLDSRFLRLASMFGRLVDYFTHPKGTQTSAFAALCPAVTLECGKPEHRHGAEHAFEYLDACLHLTEIPDHPVPAHDIDVYHTVVQVLVREDCSFGFQGTVLDLCLKEDLDHLNFSDLAEGTVLGTIAGNDGRLPVLAIDESGRDVAADYFGIEDGRLVLTRKVMPAMLTLNERIIRQDCLGYLMERIVPGN